MNLEKKIALTEGKILPFSKQNFHPSENSDI